MSFTSLKSEIVHVAGQVLKPGAVIWRDGLTVVQAVTEAGGTGAGANLRKAYILRGTEQVNSTFDAFFAA